MKISTVVLTQILFLLISLTISVSANERSRPAVGDRATVIGVRFAVGLWAVDHKMTCPSARHGNEPKIAIYSTALNDNVLDLSVAIDRLIAEDPSLKWSFIALSDEKGAYHGVSKGHYSQDEQAQRLKEIKELAAQREITRLTIGNTSWDKARLQDSFDMSDDNDVLIQFLGGESKKSREIRYSKLVRSADLNAERIDSLLLEIQELRNR